MQSCASARRAAPLSAPQRILSGPCWRHDAHCPATLAATKSLQNQRKNVYIFESQRLAPAAAARQGAQGNGGRSVDGAHRSPKGAITFVVELSAVELRRLKEWDEEPFKVWEAVCIEDVEQDIDRLQGAVDVVIRQLHIEVRGR